MSNQQYHVGDKIRLTKDIWDDGEDHHPASYLAHKNEIVIVRSLTGINTPRTASHEGRTDNSFFVYDGEYEKVDK